jgi:hypothetical protein
MAANFDKIGEAEGELQTMRLQLYDTRDAVIAAQAAQNKQNYKIVQHISDDSSSNKSAQLGLKTSGDGQKLTAKETAASQDKLVDRCEADVGGFVTLYPAAFKKRGWFDSNIKNICKNFVHNPQQKNADFLANFSPDYQTKLKSTLDGANFFSDVGQIDMQIFQNSQAATNTAQTINRGLANDQRMNPTTNLSGAAIQDELAALTRYFEQLKLDQSGSETDPVFLKLMKDKERFQAICGEDSIGTQLNSRAQAYNSSRE